MENTRRLLRWAKDTQGVQLNGIEPKSLPGRGIGIVASRKIKVHPSCSPLLLLPTSWILRPQGG